jgi:hypothetical protein
MRTLPSCDEVEALRTRRQTPPLGRDADHAAALLLPPFVASALMLSLSRTLRAALPRASVPSASRRCLASVSRLQQQLPADAAVGRPPVHDFQWLLSTEPPVPAAEKPAQDEGPEPATRPAKIRTERLRFDYLNRSMNEKGTCAVDRRRTSSDAHPLSSLLRALLRAQPSASCVSPMASSRSGTGRSSSCLAPARSATDGPKSTVHRSPKPTSCGNPSSGHARLRRRPWPASTSSAWSKPSRRTSSS